MRAGRQFLRAFERRPGWFHLAIGATPLGWAAFTRLTTNRTTFPRPWRHRSVRLLAAAAAR